MIGKRVVYLIFILLAGLFAIFYNVYFTMIFFFAVLILPFLLLFTAWLSLRKLEVKVSALPPLTKKGNDIEVKFEALNSSGLPITHLEICYTYCNEISGRKKKDKVILSVDKHSLAYAVLRLKSEHCGNIKIAVYRIKCYDLLSLGYISRKWPSWQIISVMPTLHPMAGDLIRRTADMEMDDESVHYLEHKPGNDPSEIFGVRDYKEGDRPNQIHWKLSRKNQKLIMKEYSQPLRDRSLFFLDFKVEGEGEKKLYQLDCYIEAAMSVSEGILKKGHQHRIIWYDWKEKKYVEKDIIDSDSSNEAQTALLSAAFYNTAEEEKKQYEGKEEDGSNIIYLTNELSEDKIIRLQKPGMLQLHVIYINDLQKMPLKARTEDFLRKSMISCYRIDIKNMKESIFKLGVVNY